MAGSHPSRSDRSVCSAAASRVIPTTVALLPAAAILLTGLPATLGCGSSQAPVATKSSAPSVTATPGGGSPTPGGGSPTPGGGSPTPSGDGTADVVTRDIVRKRLPPGMMSMALAYTVNVIDNSGREIPVDPHEHTFRVGDEIVVRIKPDDDVYVYIFNEGPTGNRSLLMPAEGETPRLVKKGEEISLPENDSLRFAEPAGKEALLVVATFQPSDQIKLLAREAFRRSNDTVQSQSAEQAAAEAEARKGLEQGVTSRGPSPSLVKDHPSRRTHVYPPTPADPANYAITYNGADLGKPEMVLNIPLVSETGASTPAP